MVVVVVVTLRSSEYQAFLKSPGGPVVSRESHLKTVIILSSRAAKQPENYLR